ncbi:hypothetical protein GTQ34_14450 [Muricauda sp. JGD-17]|uniref:Peptidase M61 N-terminal domain-containing protein n=1 Tax=Flagellimonas ochracea TaxID=2696472 RepID=A0A964WYY5_9FLAO|nr:hypothetical protein [Allomuricauda ochracea]NAY93114.1 hypothetical protein [Allomuricauda ochracea]
MKNSFYQIRIISILVLIISSIGILKAQVKYEVQLSDYSKIHVIAYMETSENRLYMPIQIPNDLPNGPASFVRNLNIHDQNGNVAILNAFNKEDFYEWHLENHEEKIVVEYDLLIEHYLYNRPFGLEEVANREEDGVMIIGKYLFIIPSWDEGNSNNVEFILPESWKVSTARTNNNSQMKFQRVKGIDLRENVIYIGEHKEETIKIGGVNLRVIIGASLEAKRETILYYLKPNMVAIRDLFGGTPRDYYLIVFNEGEIAGGAFNQSYSMLFEKPISDNSSVLWGHGMIHETFHLWNGRN